MIKRYILVAVILMSLAATVFGCVAMNLVADSKYDGDTAVYVSNAYDSRMEGAYSSSSVKSSVQMESPVNSRAMYPGQAQGADVPRAGSSVDRKTITTVRMSMNVKDVPASIEQISGLARASGGYVSDSSVYTNNYDSGTWRSGYITIRVPEGAYISFLGEVDPLGEVTSKSVSGQDVTEEYIDVSARLENLKRQEKRLGEVLNMSTTVEQVLSVEKEIERVRGEIDSLTGRLTYLNDRVEYSTITINLAEKSKMTYSWGIKDAFNDAVKAFISTINGMIVLAGYLLPVVILLLLAGVAITGIWRLARR